MQFFQYQNIEDDEVALRMWSSLSKTKEQGKKHIIIRVFQGSENAKQLNPFSTALYEEKTYWYSDYTISVS
jgi:hypothetical protein